MNTTVTAQLGCQSSPVTASGPVAWQFRQRSAVGKGPQSSLPWCDWVCIEREDYERYVREPNKLVQVRPLYAGHAQTPPLQPTEAMLEAARDWAIKKYGQGVGNEAAIGCWKAMFIAALSDASTVCQCQPLTRYADAPHDDGCPLAVSCTSPEGKS